MEKNKIYLNKRRISIPVMYILDPKHSMVENVTTTIKTKLAYFMTSFSLFSQDLNTEMFNRTENLRLGLIKFQVNKIE